MRARTCESPDGANWDHRLLFVFFGMLVWLSGVLPASGQEFEFLRVVEAFPVTSTDAKGRITDFKFAFLGGFNAPRPQFVDIDGDDDLDLFIQERTDELIFFQNIGSANEPDFKWITDRYENQTIGTWFKFADLDGDGDQDLFIETPFNLIQYLRNDGQPGNNQFVVAADTLRDIQNNVLFFDFGSAPDLTDIDCDGDLDLFIGRQTGTVSHYENLGLDANDIPTFRFVTDQFEGISIIGEGGLRSAKASTQTTERHGSNSLTFTDYDADGDPDMFWGDFFEPSIVFLENVGTCSEPDIGITTRRFPSPIPLLSGGFNAPIFADINNDGDFDMFVGILGGAFLTSQNAAANLYFYENVGSGVQPVYALVDSQFISTVDIGTNSIPAFVDIDADGDLDLFLSNEEDPSENLQSHLYFFENVGSRSWPSFHLQDRDFLDFNLGLNLAPSFVDIDADGDQDLFVGEWDGRLNFLRNTGTPSAPVFSTVEENFGEIDVGNNCTPVFTDIDGDGDFDLFMGELLGTVNFFRNVGTAAAPAFQFETSEFAGVHVGLYCVPTFNDLDRDGDQDLIVGSDDAGLFFLRNTGSPQAPNFVAETALALQVDQRSAPRFADIDGDGDGDFFAGGRSGGIMYYENREIITSVAPRGPDHVLPQGITHLQNYPNPFNPTTTIFYRLDLSPNELSGFHTVTIFNLLGQKIKQWSIRNDRSLFENALIWNGLDLAGRHVPTGVYFYQVALDAMRTLTRKMVLIP